MRTIERTTVFKRDFKRLSKSGRHPLLDNDLCKIVELLVNNKEPELRYRDHAMSNNWQDYRNCHIKPDLVLIYRLIGSERIVLVRLGSHSELDL